MAIRREPELKHVPLSCDTFNSFVAKEAVAAGADLINDVSGGSLDPSMMKQVAELGVPYVLMHMRGDPSSMQSERNTRYNGSVWGDVAKELQAAAGLAMRTGIPAWNIILDPGKEAAAKISMPLHICFFYLFLSLRAHIVCLCRYRILQNSRRQP